MTRPTREEATEGQDRFWLIVQEPGCIPERKGPWPIHMTAATLREFIAARPTAYLTVLTVGHDGPQVEHGPQWLQILDGRSMSTARKHNARVRAAHLPHHVAPALLPEGRSDQDQGVEGDVWWKTVIGGTHTPSGKISVKHLHPLTVKPIYDEHKGTVVGDVIAGLIFNMAITTNRERFLVAHASERVEAAEADISAARLRVKALEEGLEPFAALARVRYPEEGGAPSWIDIMTAKGECDELELRSHVAMDPHSQILEAEDFRRAAALLSSAQGETKEGFDGLPELPCGEQPGATAPATAALASDEITEDAVRDRAKALIKHMGWRPGDRAGLHSVIELMTKFGMACREITDRCAYPECGCDFDAICNVEVARRDAAALVEGE